MTPAFAGLATLSSFRGRLSVARFLLRCQKERGRCGYVMGTGLQLSSNPLAPAALVPVLEACFEHLPLRQSHTERHKGDTLVGLVRRATGIE